MIIKRRRIREYIEDDGRNPFREWLESLPECTSARIQARILRLEAGNFGDFRAVGCGVCELRCFFGPGYRIYFGLQGLELVIILGGGGKSSQKRDILTARKRWIDYKSRGVK